MHFPYVVVGSGLAGSTFAERISSQLKKRVLVVEMKKHVAGHCYDYYDKNGILIHKYGPHIFHTEMTKVWNYLSRFTEWKLYQHRVLSYVDGQLVPIPINLNTVNELFGTDLTINELPSFLEELSEPIEEINNSADVVLSQVGKYLYKKMYKNYTKKQWGVTPDKLDPQIISRVPIRENKDDRYFDDTYQGLPRNGYTEMVKNMLSSPRIKVLLGTDYKEVIEDLSYDQLIYTGPIDYFFDYEFGKLPYRSLDLHFENHEKKQYQPAAVVNYPNDYEFTRITEFKHMTGQNSDKTTILKEYPKRASAEEEPYYPVFDEETKQISNEYNKKENSSEAIFIGRLAEYKYYNMDEVVSRALEVFSEYTEPPEI